MRASVAHPVGCWLLSRVSHFVHDMLQLALSSSARVSLALMTIRFV